MLSRVAKPLFGLIVLLACPWLGASARAGFALVVPFDGEQTGCGAALWGDTGDEDRPSNEGSPWAAPLPAKVLLAWSGLQTGSGAGSTSTSGPTAGAGGTGLAGILAPNSSPPLAGGGSLLFLADERFKPPPFASRLFRPPR